MISERQVASAFHGLWNEVVPLLTPQCVHLFNEAYRSPLKNSSGISAFEVPSREDTDPSLVSEYAFHIVRLAQENSIELSDCSQDKPLLADAESHVISLFQENRYSKKDNIVKLTKNELSEALQLVENYAIFLSGRTQQEIEFTPRIPGAGFVDACVADISIGDTLFEVKTVRRNIAGKDIRQVLVYLALQAATGNRKWSEVAFFNPRRACIYRISVDKLIRLISGGRLSSEVFELMIDYFCERDIQFDYIF